MTVSAVFRCNSCDEHFAPDATAPCPVCGARTWEPVILNTAPDDSVEGVYRHHTGGAIYLYMLGASLGVAPPAWAAPAIPARVLSDDEAANLAYLDLVAPSVGENAAQLRALTRQLQARPGHASG